jgi:hypothetical protein
MLAGLSFVLRCAVAEPVEKQPRRLKRQLRCEAAHASKRRRGFTALFIALFNSIKGNEQA